MYARLIENFDIHRTQS